MQHSQLLSTSAMRQVLQAILYQECSQHPLHRLQQHPQQRQQLLPRQELLRSPPLMSVQW